MPAKICTTSANGRNDRRHTFKPGDTKTSVDEDHSHEIKDGEILEANNHTHEPVCPEVE